MSPPFRSILVPHDFSPHADRALETAIELGKQFGARIHLIHVFRIPMEMLSPYEIAMPAELVQGVREAASVRLEEALGRVRAAGLDGDVEVDSGEAADTIVKRAEAIPADLIVMGTRGLTGLKHVILGSVAERTLRLAPCPVLTVHADED